MQIGRREVPSCRALTVPIIPAATDWLSGVASHDVALNRGLLSANSEIFLCVLTCPKSNIVLGLLSQNADKSQAGVNANVCIGK